QLSASRCGVRRRRPTPASSRRGPPRPRHGAAATRTSLSALHVSGCPCSSVRLPSEGLPPAARALAAQGERLVLDLLEVPPGRERAVAAALGHRGAALLASDPASALA